MALIRRHFGVQLSPSNLRNIAMVAVESQMITLGSAAADFTLPNLAPGFAESIQLQQHVGDHGIVIAFICNHCPYVLHIEDVFSQRAEQWQQQGVNVIAISSNDVKHYPADAPDKMRAFAARNKFTFPYCYDETQTIAKAYQAACTPDFYLYDADLKLRYRGQFDAARPRNNTPVSGNDLNKAVQAIINRSAVSEAQIPSIGCNIKWKAGNAPDYFPTS